MSGTTADVRRPNTAQHTTQPADPAHEALFSFTGDAIFVVDPKTGMITGANPEAEALIGQSLTEIKKLHHSQLHPGEEAEKARREFAALVRDPASVRNRRGFGERTVLHRDGRKIPVDIFATVWADPEGKKLVLKIFRDASERRAAAERLRSSEERFRQIAEAAGDFIFEVDAEGLYTYASPVAEQILGYKPEEIVGKKHFYDFFTPEKREETKKAAFAVFERREAFHCFPNLNIRRDGKIVALETTGLPIYDATGAFAGYRGTDRDVTENKRAQEELRQSERRFRALADSSLVGIYILQDGKYSYVNPAMAAIFGYTVAEMTGMTPDQIVHPSNHAMVGENIRRRISGEVPAMRYEVLGRYRDGSVREVEVYGSTVQLNGRPALVGTLLDITERKRAERDRARLQQELGHSQRLECVGRLAGGIAHDFNNLMSVILMHAGSALDDLAAEESVRESLTAIQDSAVRAVNLGRQLMAFSSKQVLQAEVLDLNSVIADSQKLVRRLIGEDVKVVFQPGPGLLLVRGDRGQIAQILMNLAVNSRDAMPDGGTFSLETAAVQFDSNPNLEAEPGSYVMLSVRDTGTGMDQETCARVFEPFFTTKEVGKGSGLGLAVVYGIVKQNGGFVSVASQLGQGCEFKIYLPLVAEAPKPAASEKEAPIPGGWETIFVVEDEPALRSKIQDVLKQARYEVVPAQDGDHAYRLSLTDARPIHLLLTDVVMPGMSGFRLADRLHDLRPYLKVLYMSGYPAGKDGNIDAASLPNFIQKPFTKEKLLRMVRDVLDGKIPQGQRSNGIERPSALTRSL